MDGICFGWYFISSFLGLIVPLKNQESFQRLRIDSSLYNIGLSHDLTLYNMARSHGSHSITVYSRDISKIVNTV
jgi:hypothetical protein